MRSSRSSSSRGVCGQALLVVYCKCTWGDFGGRWVGIPPWCPIWVGRPVLGSSLEATKVCGGGKMSEPSKHRARKARGEEKQEEREEADWRGYTTAGDPQPQLNLHLPEIHRSRTRKGLRSALTPQNCMWAVWGGGVQDLRPFARFGHAALLALAIWHYHYHASCYPLELPAILMRRRPVHNAQVARRAAGASVDRPHRRRGARRHAPAGL
jgi:hypothetical protein